MDNQVTEVAALGRPFTLGMLYDANRDQIVPGVTLWDDKTLQNMIVENSQHSSDFKITSSDSMEEKSHSLDINASLKASFMGGLIKVGGSAKYLNDQKKSHHQSRITFQYKATTTFKQLHLFDDEMKKQLKIDDDMKPLATHVITGILYGANAFFVLDSEKMDTKSLQKMEGKLQATINKFPSFSLSGEVDLKLSDEEKAMTDKFSCTFYGDMIPEKNPASFQDALLTYINLPKLLGEKKQHSVPLKVWMMPLKSFDPSASEMKMPLSTGLLGKAQRVLEEFHDLQMRCNDCLADSYQITKISKILASFKQQCAAYEGKLRDFIAKKIPGIRAGKEDEKELLTILDEKEKSPFNSDKLNKWMTHIEREVSVIKSCVEAMEGAKILPKESDLVEEFLNPVVEDVLCFAFTSLKTSDPYLQEMTEYLDTEATGNVGPSTDDPWYFSSEVIIAMREKAKEICELSKGLKNEEKYRFVVTAIENKKYKGATIYHYRNTKLITEDFQKPTFPDAKKITERRDLLWYACSLNIDPDTAHENFVLTGTKTVTHGDKQSKSDHHLRFEEQFQLLCKEKLTGCHYWEMELNSDKGRDAGVGVCYEGIQRKGEYNKWNNIGGSSNSWSLGWKWQPELEFYIEHDGDKKTKSVPRTGISRIGLYLNWPAGTLSYYIVRGDKLHHLHTFHDSFSEPAIPCMKMWKKGTYLSLCL